MKKVEKLAKELKEYMRKHMPIATSEHQDNLRRICDNHIIFERPKLMQYKDPNSDGTFLVFFKTHESGQVVQSYNSSITVGDECNHWDPYSFIEFKP